MKPVKIQLVAVAVLLAACSSEGPTSTIIVAAEGGSVTTSTHDITIPAASLPMDTEVTLDVADPTGFPAVPGDRSVILRVDPEGTRLETAATVTIHGSQIGAAAEESVAVYQLVDGGWRQLEFSRDIETGDIVTGITYFAPIGVGITEVSEGGGTIQGTITWGDGTAVGGAPLELWLGETQVQTTQSTGEGLYRFEGLESGTYSIRVMSECTIDQAVGVASGMTVTQDLVLCGSAG